MRRFSLSVALVLCLAPITTAQTKELTVPAGTLLQCTLDEPNFSSRTAQVGDPILCHIRSLAMFGHPVFPRGAYVSGRLEDFRNPGHFFGKGRLKLEFVSLTVPGGTFPLSAKVVSVPHYRVDAEGSIRGRGHARRDAVEWAIPVMWPEKIITLPMRGPRPTLKGETRVLLRILDDLSIPTDAAVTSSATLSSMREPSKPASSVSASENSDVNSNVSSNVNSGIRSSLVPKLVYGGTRRPAAETERPWGLGFSAEIENTSISGTNALVERPTWRAPRPTLLMLKDGRAYLVTKYWIEGGQLTYVGSDGGQQVLTLDELDFQTTAKLNRERGVPFVLRSKSAEP
jgi:hypothetical protein